MFGHRYFGARFFGARFFGPAATGAVQTLTLSGIPSTSAYGSPTLEPGAITATLSGIAPINAFGTAAFVPGPVTVSLADFANDSVFGTAAFVPGAINLALTGFADADAFGSPTLRYTTTLSLAGFTDADGFGYPALVPGPVTITLAGFVDADHLGNPILQAVKKKGTGGGGKPGGVAAGQKYGTRVLIDEPGLIVALEADSGVTKTVNTRMGLYSEVTALPNALLAHSAVKAQAVTGPNRYDLLVPVAVPAGTQVWPTLHSDGNFAWFLSSGPGSRFNADAFDDGLASPFGPSTAEANKAPIFAILLEAVTITITASGIPDANAFGSMRLALNIAASGIASISALGSPTLAPGAATLSMSGFANESALGAPVLDLGAITIRPDGFADADEFGQLEITPAAVSLTLSGFANDNVFGSPVFALQAQTIDLTGIANDNGFGSPILTASVPLEVNPTWVLGFRERPIRALEYPNTSPYRILDGEPVRELNGDGPIREIPQSRIKEAV